MPSLDAQMGNNATPVQRNIQEFLGNGELQAQMLKARVYETQEILLKDF
jgi:hypothetical protein